MIILDTNVVSEPLRPTPHPSVVAWLDDQVVETLYLTAVTVAEIRYSIAALPRGKRRTRLAEDVEARILPVFTDRVLPFDEAATSSYAEIRAAARRVGTAVGDLDAIIAAIARTRGYAIATLDVTPFELADVPVINPFAMD